MTTVLESYAKRLKEKGIALSFANGHPYTRLSTKILVDYLDDDYIEKDAVYKETIDHLTETLQFELRFYRNEVRPIIIDMIKSVTDQLSDHINDNPLKSFRIEELIVFDTLVSGPMAESLAVLPDVAEFTTTVSLPEMTNEMAGILKQSLSDDSEIMEFVSNLDTEEIRAIYDKYIQTIGRHNPNYSFPTETVADIWKLTLAYLMLVYYRTNIPQNVSARRGTYETVFNIAISKIGKRLKQLVDRYRNMTKMEMLVVYTDTKNKVLYVNPPLYEGWLRQDNKPDVLLGLLVDRSPNAVTIGYIEENKQRLEEQLKKYVAAVSRRKLNDIRQLYKTALLYASRNMMRNLTDVELDMVESDPSYVTETINRIESYIDTTVLNTLSEFDETVRCDVYHIVAGIRFSFTNAYKFFKTIDDVIRDNPSMDVKEAVSFGAIRILVEMMVRHVRIDRR